MGGGDSLQPELGSTLKQLREAAGLSASKLSERCGISRQTIHKVESGGACRMRTLIKIVEAIGPGEDPGKLRAGLHRTAINKLVSFQSIDQPSDSPEKETENKIYGRRTNEETSNLLLELDALLSRAADLKRSELGDAPRELVDRLQSKISDAGSRIATFKISLNQEAKLREKEEELREIDEKLGINKASVNNSA